MRDLICADSVAKVLVNFVISSDIRVFTQVISLINVRNVERPLAETQVLHNIREYIQEKNLTSVRNVTKVSVNSAALSTTRRSTQRSKPKKPMNVMLVVKPLIAIFLLFSIKNCILHGCNKMWKNRLNLRLATQVQF